MEIPYPKTIITLIVIFVGISVWYTGCSNQHLMEDVDLTGYVETQALVTDKMLGRMTRYGMQQHRYSLRIVEANGEATLRGNIQLPGDYSVDDTITILYHPQDSGKPIVFKK